jgi:hypothetical protein
VTPHSPSIVPKDTNHDIYLVLDQFGVLGRVWRETDETDTFAPAGASFGKAT